jgi:hypothetical protein
MLEPCARVAVAAGALAGAGKPGGGGARGGAQLRRSVTALAFLPGSTSLAAGGDMDGVVRVWDCRMLARGPAVSLHAPAAGSGGGAPGGAGSPAAAAAGVGITTPLGRGALAPAPGRGTPGRGTPGSGGRARGSGGKARARGGPGGGGDGQQPWLSVTCPHRGRPHGITSLQLSPAGGLIRLSAAAAGRPHRRGRVAFFTSAPLAHGADAHAPAHAAPSPTPQATC